MKTIADRLLLSRAWFLLDFTIVKLNKNKMKKVLITLGLQHRSLTDLSDFICERICGINKVPQKFLTQRFDGFYFRLHRVKLLVEMYKRETLRFRGEHRA